METNKIDKIVRDSLQSRTIQPSSSAWERLSDQLDVMEAPKKINWFKYAGYAASILLLISVAFFINSNDDITPIKKNDIVTAPVIDTTKLIQPNFKNTVPEETVIVKKEETIDEKKTVKEDKRVIVKRRSTELKVPNAVKQQNKIVVAQNKMITKEQIVNTRIKIDADALLTSVTNTKIAETKKVIIAKPSKKAIQYGSIRVNSDALLYAVQNPNKDINQYYKKYKIDRAAVLKNIQTELVKMNLKIDANSILADVEKSIDEETFKNSFMQTVKGKITGFASAFSNRNN